MGKKDKYLVGLDIGSTKTCVLIAEVEGELVKFLALGAAESKGLRKGLIVNLDSTVSSIRRAVEEAESVANVPVEEYPNVAWQLVGGMRLLFWFISPTPAVSEASPFIGSRRVTVVCKL